MTLADQPVHRPDFASGEFLLARLRFNWPSTVALNAIYGSKGLTAIRREEHVGGGRRLALGEDNLRFQFDELIFQLGEFEVGVLDDGGHVTERLAIRGNTAQLLGSFFDFQFFANFSERTPHIEGVDNEN